MTALVPYHVGIEITTRCGARCVICQHSVIARKNRDMAVGRIVDYVEQARDIGARVLSPHFMGEPTLHPDFSDVLRRVHERCPGVSIWITTNGCRLHERDVRDVIREHVACLTVSIDGGTNETMRRMRPGVDPEKVEEGIRALHAERVDAQHPMMGPRMTLTPETRGEVEAFDRRWAPYRDGGPNVKPLVHWLGDRPDLDAALRDMTRPCEQPFWFVRVTVDDQLLVCCHDYRPEYPIADLTTMSLRDAWYGDAMRAFRQMHLEGRLAEHPMCSRCSHRNSLTEEQRQAYREQA